MDDDGQDADQGGGPDQRQRHERRREFDLTDSAFSARAGGHILRERSLSNLLKHLVAVSDKMGQ